MGHTIRQVTAVVMQVEDRVGILHEVLCVLRDAGVNMLAIASQRRQGTALMAIPENPQRVRQLAAQHGVRLQTRQVFLVEGDDQVGALCGITEAIANAEINIEDIAALSAANRYAAVITFADADLEAAAKALGLEEE
ncbi:MAG: ACT domain-containing protein [Armatimonadota bacterium]|nr:ACT domain-containing protein [Armatimonadota bacterium]